MHVQAMDDELTVKVAKREQISVETYKKSKF